MSLSELINYSTPEGKHHLGSGYCDEQHSDTVCICKRKVVTALCIRIHIIFCYKLFYERIVYPADTDLFTAVLTILSQTLTKMHISGSSNKKHKAGLVALVTLKTVGGKRVQCKNDKESACFLFFGGGSSQNKDVCPSPTEGQSLCAFI